MMTESQRKAFEACNTEGMWLQECHEQLFLAGCAHQKRVDAQVCVARAKHWRALKNRAASDACLDCSETIEQEPT